MSTPKVQFILTRPSRRAGPVHQLGAAPAETKAPSQAGPPPNPPSQHMDARLWLGEDPGVGPGLEDLEGASCVPHLHPPPHRSPLARPPHTHPALAGACPSTGTVTACTRGLHIFEAPPHSRPTYTSLCFLLLTEKEHPQELAEPAVAPESPSRMQRQPQGLTHRPSTPSAPSGPRDTWPLTAPTWRLGNERPDAP